jgi:formylglycine-generating enzyme required for sulfatase activity
MRSLGAIILAVMLCGMASQAHAEKRAALVIGNSSYRNVPSLPNPSNDAADIAALLRSAGFSAVDVRRDLGISDMRRAISDFAEAASDVDVAVVYFAGHGIEVDGSNYVIPVDAKLLRDFDIEDETVSVERILKSIEPARKLRLVILDACRDNPFLKTMKRTVASRSVGRGLAKVEPAVSDTLIAFAAKAGSVALDGDARNSPFTVALLHNIASPGLDLRIAFGRVRDEVLKATNRKQEPFVYGSLGGSVISIVDAPKIVPPLPTDEIVWNAIKDSSYPAIFDDFASKFPASPRLPDALSRRDQLKKQIAAAAARIPPPPTADEIVWNAIKDSGYPAIFEDFVSKFPASPHLAEAQRRRDDLKQQIAAAAARIPPPPAADEIVWNAIKGSNYPAIFEDFISKFPASLHLAEAQLRRDDLRKQIAAAQAPPAPAADDIVWSAIKGSRDPAIFEEFISKYSASPHLADATLRRDELKKQIAAAQAPPPPAADDIVWHAIKESRDPAIFEEFASKYSASPYLADARQRRDDLRKQMADAAARIPPPPATDQIVWDAIKDARAPQIFEEFLNKFPESSRLGEARSRLQELKSSLVASTAASQSLPGIKNERSKTKEGNIGLNVLSGSDEASLKQKADFRECEKCPEMIVVPAGSFGMGSDDDGPKRASTEAPRHKVTFAHAFAVGRFAVTFEQWDACVDDGGCNGYKPWDNGWGRGKRPAINISWSDAKSYVAWLSERTGKPYRLLSEAEREYVTRAGTSSTFWWGASISRRQANYDDKTGQDKTSKGSSGQRTIPVDSYQPNPWGLYQVHGNIWEWVEDCLNEGYAGAPTDGTAWMTGHCDRRVLRGGSWVSSANAVEAGSRYGVQAEGRVSNVGFRVARTLKE